MTRESSLSKSVQSLASQKGLSARWLIDTNCGGGFMVWLPLCRDLYEVDSMNQMLSRQYARQVL